MFSEGGALFASPQHYSKGQVRSLISCFGRSLVKVRSAELNEFRDLRLCSGC